METPTAREIAQEVAAILGKETQEWITEKEAMNLLGVKRTTLYNFTTGGKITYSTITGRNRLFSRRSIMRFIENNTVKAIK